jgi:hypothetical protein
VAHKRTNWRTKENRARVKGSLRLLRSHLRGYEPRDGFSLKDSGIDQLSSAQKRSLITRAQNLEKLLASPHTLLRATNSKQRRSLYQFTRQKLRRAKHFIVHLPSEKHHARLVKGRLSIRGTYTGGVATETRYFLLPRRPRTHDDALEMLQLMLPEMPEGFYSILTGLLGDTGEPTDKGQLLTRTRDYLLAYESKGFELVGFRFMSTTLRGMEIQRERFVDQRRQRQKEINRRKHEGWMTPAEKAERKVRQDKLAKKLRRSKAAKKAARTRARKGK